MSKRKPYSKIENARMLRDIGRKEKKFYASTTAETTIDWKRRLVLEEFELHARVVRLDDFLYVKETADSETTVSKEAAATGSRSVALLKRQLKAMREYLNVLRSRIALAGLDRTGK